MRKLVPRRSAWHSSVPQCANTKPSSTTTQRKHASPTNQPTSHLFASAISPSPKNGYERDDQVDYDAAAAAQHCRLHFGYVEGFSVLCVCMWIFRHVFLGRLVTMCNVTRVRLIFHARARASACLCYTTMQRGPYLVRLFSGSKRPPAR